MAGKHGPAVVIYASHQSVVGALCASCRMQQQQMLRRQPWLHARRQISQGGTSELHQIAPSPQPLLRLPRLPDVRPMNYSAITNKLAFADYAGHPFCTSHLSAAQQPSVQTHTASASVRMTYSTHTVTMCCTYNNHRLPSQLLQSINIAGMLLATRKCWPRGW